MEVGPQFQLWIRLEKYYTRYCNNDWTIQLFLETWFLFSIGRTIDWETYFPYDLIRDRAKKYYYFDSRRKIWVTRISKSWKWIFHVNIYFLYIQAYSSFLSLTNEVIVLDFERVRNQISSFKDRFLLRFLYSFESMKGRIIRYWDIKRIGRKCARIRSNDDSRRKRFQRWINSIYRENSLSTILQLDPTAFGQRLLTVPWVQRGIQQPGCIYYFTGTRVLYGSGWSGLVKRQHDTGRVVDATTTSGRGMHRWRASAAFYMPPRRGYYIVSTADTDTHRAGVGGRRAAQWQEHSPGNLRLSGCSWKCFARYWYSGLTTKCLVNTKKSSAPWFSTAGWKISSIPGT